MRCEQVRSYLSPYLDSELEGKTTFEISRHLEICSACVRLFALEVELDRAISDSLKRPEGDEAAVLERALARALSLRSLPRSGWFRSAAALLLALIAWVWWERPRRSEAPGIVVMVAGDHLRYLRGEARFECTSKQPEEVASFLAGYLEQSACALPAGDSWEIAGARICRFEGVRVGLVTLLYGGIPISVGDLPEGEGPLPHDAMAAAVSGHCFEIAGGRAMVGRTACGLRVVFGDVQVARLEEVIAAAGMERAFGRQEK